MTSIRMTKATLRNMTYVSLFNYTSAGLVFRLFQFRALLMERWNESKQHKAMNYDLNCMYKLLPGDYNLSIQVGAEGKRVCT